MCAMVSAMSKTLEDYVTAMANRKDDADIQKQLMDKERDLVLAAELGKELLNKNEELWRQNEKITEDYTRQLESLEQDKHQLKRRLDAALQDHEIRVADLQTDINDLRRALEEQQSLMKSVEKEKTACINELSEQNQRLTIQLKEASVNEESLTKQLKSLKDQYSIRKNVISDHASHLDNLREEIILLTGQKNDLETKIERLLKDREDLSHDLEDQTDRIFMLEKQNREHEQQLMHSRMEMDEIKALNQTLSSRLELLNRSATVNRSLLNEIELSADFRTTSGLSAASSGIGAEDDDIESDEGLSPSASSLKELKEEMWIAYCTILAMCNQLKSTRSKSEENNSCTSMETSLNDTRGIVKPGQLTNGLEELKNLLRDMSSMEGIDGNGTVKTALELEMRLHRAEESLDKNGKHLQEKKEENRRLKEQLDQLTSQVTIKEAELSAVTEERDNARRDLNETHLAKDEIVKKAWDLRDQAVQRKNKAEIEVAKTRIDMMQVNSQLMEAIQQKIQLSQQLEQWQVDMQQLLEDQMRTKMDQDKKTKSISDNKSFKATSTSPSSSQLLANLKKRFKF